MKSSMAGQPGRSGQLLARTGEAARLDQAPRNRRRLVVRQGRLSTSAGFPTGSSTSRPIVSTGIWRRTAIPIALIWEPDDPAEQPQAGSPIASCTREVCKLRQCAQGSRRREGRPRHDLFADDPRSRGCVARLRADRGDPFGRVRRVFARGIGGPDRGLRVDHRHHRRRRAAGREEGAAKGQCRCRARSWRPGLDTVIVVKATGGDVAMGDGDHWYHEVCSRPLRPTVKAGTDVGRRPALHPLYQSGSTGKAQGRAPHHRRLPCLGQPQPRTHLRLPSGTRFIGARRISAGSPGTAISFTARSRTAARR